MKTEPPETSRRRLAHDSTTGRVGEVMEITRVNGIPTRIHLRPVGGGREWSADPDDVRLVQDAEQATT
jgi:hypothetical protein